MASVTVTDSSGRTYEWDRLTLADEHQILHILGAYDRRTVPPVAANTGACLCTSFRWDTHSGKCLDCGHVSHGSRIHCGGINV